MHVWVWPGPCTRLLAWVVVRVGMCPRISSSCLARWKTTSSWGCPGMRTACSKRCVLCSNDMLVCCVLNFLPQLCVCVCVLWESGDRLWSGCGRCRDAGGAAHKGKRCSVVMSVGGCCFFGVYSISCVGMMF